MAFVPNNVYTILGAKGSGKTPFFIGGEWEIGMANLWLREKNMSTLVIDEIDHERYRHVPIIQPHEYGKLQTHKGIYRTLAAAHHIPKLLEKIAVEKLVWNTLIGLEDYHKYLHNPFTGYETILFGNSKQQNNDLALMSWDWGFLYPDIARMTNYYVVMPTASSPECRKMYLTGCYDKVFKAWQLVKAKKKPYLIVDSGL